MSSFEIGIDPARKSCGYLTPSELSLVSSEMGFHVLDLYSTLVSPGVEIGRDTVLYPGVVILRDSMSQVSLGEANQLWPSTIIMATNGGQVAIGDNNGLGPGGLQLKANYSNSSITVGDHTRLLNAPEIVGVTRIGSGAQIIGAVAVQSCTLAGGEDFTHPDPDRRGSVLKGTGLARNVTLGKGEVVNGLGDFNLAPVERQSKYHPKAPSA